MERVAQYHTKLGMDAGKSQPILQALDQTGSASQQLSCSLTHQRSCQQLVVLAILVSKPESLVFELVDPEPKTTTLELEITRVAEHYNYKDSDTQDVVKAHMCWHLKPNDILLDCQSEHYEQYILAIDY